MDHHYDATIKPPTCPGHTWVELFSVEGTIAWAGFTSSLQDIYWALEERGLQYACWLASKNNWNLIYMPGCPVH